MARRHAGMLHEHHAIERLPFGSQTFVINNSVRISEVEVKCSVPKFSAATEI
jgi:hypothetical protein